MIVVDGLYAIKTEGIDLSIFIELEQEHQMVQALKPKADVLITMEYEVAFVK